MGKYTHIFNNEAEFNAQYNGDTKIPIAVTADCSYKYGGMNNGGYHMWLPLNENGEWDDNSETLYSYNFIIDLNDTNQLWSLDGYLEPKTVTAINYVDNPNTYEEPWLSCTVGRGIDYSKNDPRIYDGGTVLDLRGAATNPNLIVNNKEQLESNIQLPDAYKYYALKASVYETFDGCNGYPIIATLLIDDADKPSGENTASIVLGGGSDECVYQANGTPWVIHLGPSPEIRTNYSGD